MQLPSVGFADVENDGFGVCLEINVTARGQYVCFQSPMDYYRWTSHDARQIANLMLDLADRIDQKECPHYLSEMGHCVGCGKAI